MKLYFLRIKMNPFIYLFLALFSISANANEISAIQLSIGTDCKEYGLTEDFGLIALLSNSSKNNYFIHTKDMWRKAPYGFNLRVIKNGQNLKIRTSHAIPPENEVRDKQNYTNLQPDMLVGERTMFSIYDVFKESGLYTIYVEYTSPIPLKISPFKNIWSRDMPTLYSNKVNLKINQVGTYCRRKSTQLIK